MIDFEALLAQAPNPYVVLDRDLIIVWMNEAYLRATMRTRDEILGRSMFDAFPSPPDSDSHRQLGASFERVLATGEHDEIAHIRYDISNSDGTMDERYWSATHTPFKNAEGEVACILQHTVDVTELHGLRRMRDEMDVVKRAEAVERRNRGLEEESQQLKSLFEQAPGFVAVLQGRDHRFVMANAAYRSLVGERPLMGKTVGEALPEVVDQGFVDVLDRVHAFGEPYFGRREKVGLQTRPEHDPEQLYLEFIFQPIFDEAGVVSGVFVQGHDVTEEVEAEERQNLLINELNHRVKNTLAIVQGLAQQSFAEPGRGNDALERFSARLAALASAHNLLTACNWEAADLREVIAGSLDATAGFDADRYELEGPRVVLRPQPAVALAMIVHELSTNAIKHGAFSTPEGHVAVSWTAHSEGERCRIALDWIERGGPPVHPPEQQGFGTRLIRRGLGERDGRVEIDYRPEGVRCRIEAYA